MTSKRINRMVKGEQFQRRILPWGLGLILAIASFSFGFPGAAHAQFSENTGSAEEIFRAAYDNRYTWDEDFPGFAAEVSINHEGEVDQGIVRVEPDLSVDVINIDREEVRELIANQLQMEVTHRRRIPFEQIHGHSTFTLEGKDEEGAWQIREAGSQMESFYKIKENIITQVNRTFDGVAVTVDTIGTTNSPEGYLVVQFQTNFRDANTGEVLEREDVRDFHQKVGKYRFLSYRALRFGKEGNPADKLNADTLMTIKAFQPL